MNSTIFRKTRKFAPILTFFLALLLLLTPTVLAQSGLKIYYVRHGESGYNVVKEWKDKPEDQWPSYVGNPDIFTPKGESQVAELTQKLKGMKFDFIAASPKWRTRNTILPYLKAMNLKAEIWPELTETKSVPVDRIKTRDLLAASPTLFAGDAIDIPPSESSFFILRDDVKANPKIEKGEEQRIANAIALGEQTIKIVKERFAGSNKSILLVGHSSAGSTLIRLLTGVMDFSELENTKIWMAEEQPDGSFSLKMLNNEPFKEMKEAK
jgi:broad specificity phosphatase PhoE